MIGRRLSRFLDPSSSGRAAAGRPALAVLAALGLALCAAGPAFAEERFPPPEFTGGYSLPEPTVPQPRATGMSVVDLAALAAALSLAAWLAIKVRSRRALFVLMVVSLLYFGFYRKGCVCPIGAIQNVALALFSPDYPLPWIVAGFFVLPLVFALFVGRVFCGAVCPLGAIQDVFLIRPVKLPAGLSAALSVLPYVYLAVAVLYAVLGSTFLICEYDPFVAFFRLDGRFNLLLLGGSLLVISMFVGRPYCRFLCPYGVLLGWLAPLARWRIKIHPKQCIQCRMCEEACPFGAILPATPEPKPERRYEGRLRLAGLLFALPALVAAGAWLGRSGGDQLAQLNFTVALAGRIYAEEEKRVTGVTDESDAFRKQGGAPEELYASAEAIKGRFRSGATAVGAFLGLVVGWQLVALSTRRRRTEYLADQSKCVACGRCYLACPGERERLGLVGVVEAK